MLPSVNKVTSLLHCTKPDECSVVRAVAERMCSCRGTHFNVSPWRSWSRSICWSHCPRLCRCHIEPGRAKANILYIAWRCVQFASIPVLFVWQRRLFPSPSPSSPPFSSPLLPSPPPSPPPPPSFHHGCFAGKRSRDAELGRFFMWNHVNSSISVELQYTVSKIDCATVYLFFSPASRPDPARPLASLDLERKGKTVSQSISNTDLNNVGRLRLNFETYIR